MLKLSPILAKLRCPCLAATDVTFYGGRDLLSNLFKCAECQSPIDVVLSSLTRVEEGMRETEDRTDDEITNPFHVLISWLSQRVRRRNAQTAERAADRW